MVCGTAKVYVIPGPSSGWELVVVKFVSESIEPKHEENKSEYFARLASSAWLYIIGLMMRDITNERTSGTELL